MTLSDLETLQREKPTLHWAALRLHDQTTRFDIVTRVCTGMLLWVSHAPVVRNGGPCSVPKYFRISIPSHGMRTSNQILHGDETRNILQGLPRLYPGQKFM